LSKAFTSEETPDPGAMGRPPPRLAPGEVRYVTPEGHAALRGELDRVRERLAAASELPESERTGRVEELERRAALLQGTLSAVTVLGPEAAPADVAAFARWVTVEDEAGSRHTWRLVGPDEADAARGLVSVHSPVGRALLGRRPAEQVEVERPRGTSWFTVVAVRGTPP
jgi:transcription elongation factor GreB